MKWGQNIKIGVRYDVLVLKPEIKKIAHDKESALLIRYMTDKIDEMFSLFGLVIGNREPQMDIGDEE